MRQRKVVAVVAVLVLIAGAAWWKLRGGDPPAQPAAVDPWAAKPGIDEAKILADKRAAHGDAPADVTPASASGRITRRADGSGAAGAVVSLQPKDIGIGDLQLPGTEDKVIVVVADPTGAWSAPAVAPGDYVLTATSPGLLPGSRDDIALVAGANRTGLDLALDAGGATVRGTVSDIGGGPIPDARVRVRGDDIAAFKGKSGSFTAITGADGTYQLTLADGSWVAVVSQVDYTPAEKSFTLSGAPATVDFTLTPGSVIRGQVIVRATGKPAPRALVRAEARSAGRWRDNKEGSVFADDDGNFTLKGLGSGAIEISAAGRGYASAAPTSVALGIGEEVDGVKVMVDRAYTISGFVVKKGDERTGIPGVQVGAFSIGTMQGMMSTQPSGKDGYFEILGVHPASYLLFAIGRDVMPDVGKPVAVKDADVTDVLVVMEVGATLSGRVEPGAVSSLSLEVDPDKIGITNMFDVLKAVVVSGESDATGKFTVRNVPPGEFTLVAKVKDGRTGRLPVTVAEADQTGLVIPLEPRAAIIGRVVDPSGVAVPGVGVHANPTGGAGMKFRMQDNPSSVTGPDGAFRIGGLTPGKFALGVNDDQGRLALADPAHKADPSKPFEVDITGSSDVTGVTLTVEPRDGVIRGVVLGVDRKPAADVWVTATMAMPVEVPGDGDKKVTITVGSSGSSMSEEGGDGEDEELGWGAVGPQDPVLTDDNGRFTVSRLRRGTYQLIAEGDKGATRARKTGVKSGDNVTLVLETLGSLAGTVMAGTAPVKDYTISCKGPAGNDLQHVIAEDGAYMFERRPAGKYTCTVTSEVGPATGEATVKGATRLDLTIGSWGAITGVVVNAKTGAPMPGLKLAAMGASGMPTGLEELLTGGGPSTDATGRFEIGKQTAGKGTLMIFDGGLTGIHVIANKEYTLTSGQRLDLGTIKGLPPRVGPAGTLGLTTVVNDGKLVVEGVTPGGPAARAGVVAGDKILAIDTLAVAELTTEIADDMLDSEHVAAGQVVTLELSRTPPVDLAVTADPLAP
jgi:hypothetical protein